MYGLCRLTAWCLNIILCALIGAKMFGALPDVSWWVIICAPIGASVVVSLVGLIFKPRSAAQQMAADFIERHG